MPMHAPFFNFDDHPQQVLGLGFIVTTTDTIRSSAFQLHLPLYSDSYVARAHATPTTMHLLRTSQVQVVG